ncbi:hypothetical protein MUK42_34099 [Musa troglodytarum]|uniref:Uncharacterized protein n=1 Tax=Musa troglodytarum TaxID=320322 RepID=A0A9E7EA20_9LILI|nr:hypothetical protein MUK42_34099 [Musa troglodytarum]
MFQWLLTWLQPRYVDGEKMRWTGELLDARGAREGRLATEWCGRTAPTGLDEKGSLVTTCPFISTLLHRSRISVRQLRRYLFDCKTTHGREFVRPREVMGLQREKIILNLATTALRDRTVM